jgi:hypothetical protein
MPSACFTVPSSALLHSIAGQHEPESVDDFIGIRRVLPVSWYAQMVSANCVIEEASTETSCPAQAMVKTVMPVGRFDAGVMVMFYSRYLRQQ